MEVVGFIVARLPQFNSLVPKRDVVPSVNGVYYSGVYRCNWADVFDEEYYSKKIPENILHLAETIKSTDTTFLDVCKNYETAIKLLEYANRNSVANELIAIRAPQLEKIKGVIKTSRSIDWLGFDFVALGEWSLIEAGIFRYPHHYYNWLMRLNQYGLFNDPALLSEYVKTYKESIDKEKAEPIASKKSQFPQIAIEVGRVQLDEPVILE